MRTRSAVVAVLLTLASLASAEGMKVEPGQWEIRSVATLPMSPEPKIDTRRECMENDHVDPREFLAELPGECRVSDIVSSDTAMSWKLHCTQAGGSLAGVSQYTSTGSTFEGSNQMTMTAAGTTLEFESTHTGKRLGDCP